MATGLLKKEVESLVLPDIKRYYKVIVIKTIQNLHRERQVDQWNRK